MSFYHLGYPILNSVCCHRIVLFYKLHDGLVFNAMEIFCSQLIWKDDLGQRQMEIRRAEQI